MIYDFDQMPGRRRTACLKWDTYDEDVLPMWVADMDFVSPLPVLEALRRTVEHGVFGYPDGVHGEPGELLGFRQLIVDRLAEKYDWQIHPQDLVFVPGVVTGFNMACHALAVPGGGVLVQPPVYPPILEAAQNAKIIRQEAELARSPDGSYTIDWDTFATAITADTCLFILSNPHNPVGRVFRQDELERMADLCLQHHIVICSDEIHSDLIYQGSSHIPIAAINPEIAQSTITLIAPSKTYNLAGLQCSMAIIQNSELRQRFRGAGKGLVEWVNLMGLVAAQAAYRDGQEWLSQLLAYLESNRDYLCEYVRRELKGITVARPEGMYLAWLDCRGAGLGDNPSRFFLEKAKVALNDGATFGSGGQGFARLNFGCPRALLEEGLGRMRIALRSI
jgi:cysteine-S-conjugate beta-lyase